MTMYYCKSTTRVHRSEAAGTIAPNSKALLPESLGEVCENSLKNTSVVWPEPSQCVMLTQEAFLLHSSGKCYGTNDCLKSFLM